MTNSKALFYPTIEINDENWLKANLLFWDEIRTIVPEKFESAYSNRTTSILAERKILKPEKVNPDHSSVKAIAEHVLDFINTEEGFQLFTIPDDRFKIHRSKIDGILEEIIEEILTSNKIQEDKKSDKVNSMMLAEDGAIDEFLSLNSSFATYYMTLLANRICDDTGLRLLTNNPLCANLSKKLKQGFNKFNPELGFAQLNEQLSHGIFTNLVLETINFHPSTNVIDILSFKQDHSDALGLFRSNVKKLLKNISPDSSINAMREEVLSIYHDEFLPSYNNLKKQLKQTPIKWTCDKVAKIGFFSVGAAAIPTVLLGMTVPQALLIGGGISLVSSLVSYNIDRQELLRENPYNYLLEINKTL